MCLCSFIDELSIANFFEIIITIVHNTLQYMYCVLWESEKNIAIYIVKKNINITNKKCKMSDYMKLRKKENNNKNI